MHPLDQDSPHRSSVYRALIDDIASGVLSPGDRLREATIAERLGVSRTPVREALRQLEAEGLVSHLPRSGATIRKLDYAEVMELYEMRAMLEGSAARMAARAAAPIELAELETINRELEAAQGDADRQSQLNRRFHRMLLDAAKNRFLTRAMGVLSRTLLILGPSTLSEPERASLAVAEHARLLEALRSRDPDAAEREMRLHIGEAHKARMAQFRNRERLELPD